jgi:5-methylcytosine-specific restriction endonuclease McrA
MSKRNGDSDSRYARQTPKGMADDLAGTPCECCGIDDPVFGTLCPSVKSRLMHLHHIIPVSSGGHSRRSNFAWLCPNCHRVAHILIRELRALGQYTRVNNWGSGGSGHVGQQRFLRDVREFAALAWAGKQKQGAK